jgi:hypothetical protein
MPAVCPQRPLDSRPRVQARLPFGDSAVARNRADPGSRRVAREFLQLRRHARSRRAGRCLRRAPHRPTGPSRRDPSRECSAGSSDGSERAASQQNVRDGRQHQSPRHLCRRSPTWLASAADLFPLSHRSQERCRPDALEGLTRQPRIDSKPPTIRTCLLGQNGAIIHDPELEPVLVRISDQGLDERTSNPLAIRSVRHAAKAEIQVTSRSCPVSQSHLQRHAALEHPVSPGAAGKSSEQTLEDHTPTESAEIDTG